MLIAQNMHLEKDLFVQLKKFLIFLMDINNVPGMGKKELVKNHRFGTRESFVIIALSYWHFLV